MEDFINIKDFNDGHAYYVERSTGRIAVADMGRFGMFNKDYGPRNTEDGVMYLDFTRNVEERHGRVNTKYLIPLIPAMGATFTTIVSEAERQWIKETFNW
jgi:hypothetical protein